MIKDEIKLLRKKTGLRELRKFAYTVGTVFILISLYLLIKSSGFYIYPGLAGLVLFILGIWRPESLKRLYIGWMFVAILIGYVMTGVILTLIYFIIFTPVALILKLAGKDILHQKIEPQKDTYWVMKEDDSSIQFKVEKQF
jgi:hypothetical protein